MKFISFQVTHPSSKKWEAVNSTHGRLGGTSYKRKIDLVEAVEERYNGNMLSNDVVLVPVKNIAR